MNRLRVSVILALISTGLLAALGFTARELWRAGGAAPLLPHSADVGYGWPVFEKDSRTQQFDARSVILWSPGEQRILFEQNAFERRPIASLTKLMTAMVALDYGINWEQEADIKLAEYGLGGQLLLHPGEKVTMRDLFNASLVGSANNATLAYVRTLAIPPQEFVQAMNRKAIQLGLEQTTFVEVTGLDPGNVSTAYDMARLAAHAFSEYQAIAAATSQPEYTFKVSSTAGLASRMAGEGREHTIRNTNKLISDEGMRFGGSKTGYLDEADFCLVVQYDNHGAPAVAVILGSPSEQFYFADMKRLMRLPTL